MSRKVFGLVKTPKRDVNLMSWAAFLTANQQDIESGYITHKIGSYHDNAGPFLAVIWGHRSNP